MAIIRLGITGPNQDSKSRGVWLFAGSRGPGVGRASVSQKSIPMNQAAVPRRCDATPAISVSRGRSMFRDRKTPRPRPRIRHCQQAPFSQDRGATRPARRFRGRAHSRRNKDTIRYRYNQPAEPGRSAAMRRGGRIHHRPDSQGERRGHFRGRQELKRWSDRADDQVTRTAPSTRSRIDQQAGYRIYAVARRTGGAGCSSNEN